MRDSVRLGGGMTRICPERHRTSERERHRIADELEAWGFTSVWVIQDDSGFTLIGGVDTNGKDFECTSKVAGHHMALAILEGAQLSGVGHMYHGYIYANALPRLESFCNDFPNLEEEAG